MEIIVGLLKQNKTKTSCTFTFCNYIRFNILLKYDFINIVTIVFTRTNVEIAHRACAISLLVTK